MQTQRVSATLRDVDVRPSSYAQLARVCLFGALLRVACVWYLDPQPAWDGKIYERAAEQLARGDGYTQRILDPSAPARATAFFPPGFPAILSLLHRAAGGRGLDRSFQIAVSVSLIPCAWLFGRRIGGVRVGAWAAWLIALWPGGILLSASWLTEPLFALQLSAALLPILYARERKRWAALAVSAIALGFAAYVRPTALAIAPFVGATALGARPKRRIAAAISGSIAALVLACLPLMPWLARNLSALHAPVLVSTNAGSNLLLGTIGDGGYRRLERPFDCPPGRSEVELDRCRRERALERIAADPSAWLGRGALKLLYTFGHESAPAQLLAGQPSERARALAPVALACTRAFWTTFLGFSIFGVWRAYRLGLGSRLLRLTGPIAGTLVLHFVFIGGDRYHVPLVPILAALAAYGALHIRSRRAALPS